MRFKKGFYIAFLMMFVLLTFIIMVCFFNIPAGETNDNSIISTSYETQEMTTNTTTSTTEGTSKHTEVTSDTDASSETSTTSVVETTNSTTSTPTETEVVTSTTQSNTTLALKRTTTAGVTTTVSTTKKKVTTTTTKATKTDISDTLIPVGVFKLTYYTPTKNQNPNGLKGGSGRTLLDCSTTSSGVMGSVASKSIVMGVKGIIPKYGYSYKGKQTTIYMDVPNFPELSGYYFVDDCSGGDYIVDLYYSNKNNCPFKNQGVIKNAMVYVVNNEGE